MEKEWWLVGSWPPTKNRGGCICRKNLWFQYGGALFKKVSLRWRGGVGGPFRLHTGEEGVLRSTKVLGRESKFGIEWEKKSHP